MNHYSIPASANPGFALTIFPEGPYWAGQTVTIGLSGPELMKGFILYGNLGILKGFTSTAKDYKTTNEINCG